MPTLSLQVETDQSRFVFLQMRVDSRTRTRERIELGLEFRFETRSSLCGKCDIACHDLQLSWKVETAFPRAGNLGAGARFTNGVDSLAEFAC
jgi:hypothetical protein